MRNFDIRSASRGGGNSVNPNGDEVLAVLRHSEGDAHFMPEESHSLCDLSLVAQDDGTKHVIVSECETIQSIYNQKPFQGKIDRLRETSCPPLAGGEFAYGRRESSPDSSEFPRPLWERVRVRGTSKNNNKLLIIDWIVSHTLTMTKNFANNAILRGLNDCSPQNDGKNSCRLMRGEVGSKRRKVAFTLAEVLITLGIIGVVAALTLPSVVNNVRHRQLETGFKAAYSIFSQAVQNMKREDGEGLAKNYAYYDPISQTNPREYEFYKKFYEYSGLKVVGKCDYKNIKIMNYTNDAEAKSYCIRSSKVDGSCNYVDLKDELSNGMCSVLTVTASTLFFVVDVNGTKNPNRLGHDIFWFKINKNDMLEPLKMTKLYTEEELEADDIVASYVLGNPCSIKSKQAGNGTGCAYSALIDQNPDDSTKGYWESLPR